MNAKEARKLLAKSNDYKNACLEKIYLEVRSQCAKGLSWANVTLDAADHPDLITDVQATLVLNGYHVENKSHSNQFTITW